MQEIAVNYWAVLVATIAKVVIAGIWFAIPPFGKAWADATAGGDTAAARKRAPMGLVVDLVATFVMAWVLAHALGYAGAKGVGQGAMAGFFNWLGFILAAQVPALAWDARPARFFVVAQIYLLIAFLVMGGIIGGWS